MWSICNGYGEQLEIDRIDNDKGYCPDNCRWVTHKENMNNRRKTLSLPTGESLAEFCERCGIKTRDGGKKSRVYHSICEYFRRTHELHPKYFKEAVKAPIQGS